jgi:hypothetical protein
LLLGKKEVTFQGLMVDYIGTVFLNFLYYNSGLSLPVRSDFERAFMKTKIVAMAVLGLVMIGSSAFAKDSLIAPLLSEPVLPVTARTCSRIHSYLKNTLDLKSMLFPGDSSKEFDDKTQKKVVADFIGVYDSLCKLSLDAHVKQQVLMSSYDKLDLY